MLTAVMVKLLVLLRAPVASNELPVALTTVAGSVSRFLKLSSASRKRTISAVGSTDRVWTVSLTSIVTARAHFAESPDNVDVTRTSDLHGGVYDCEYCV